MVRPVTDDDTGLKVLFEPPPGTLTHVDIIAIHGIAAHPDDTWCKNIGFENGEPQYVNWLKDMLPSAVPNARIMRYGYMSQWHGPDKIRTNVSNVARRLLLALKDMKTDPSCKTRPLLFVAHCFGGLVVLKALLKAKMDAGDWPNIYNTVTGIVFFGTPFRGAEQVTQMEMIRAAQTLDPECVPAVLRITQPEDELLLEMVRDFERSRARSTNRTLVACFYELKPCDVMVIVGRVGKKSFRVSEGSGCLDAAENMAGLERTHFDMNKFGKSTEEDYRIVQSVIKDMVDAAPALVAARSQSITSLSVRIPDSPRIPTESEASRIFSELGYDGPLTAAKDLENATRVAVRNKNTQAVQLLVSLGADISAMSALPEPVLFQAIRNNDPDMITLLINCGVNIHNSVKGNTPLQLAAALGARDAVSCLEHHGAKWDFEGRFWQFTARLGSFIYPRS